MDNNLDNAIAFYLERKSSTLTPFINKSIAQIMVEYAASVRPEVVVPSEEEIQKAAEEHAGGVYVKNHVPITFDNRRAGFRNGVRWILQRLNPSMTFTELNHEK